MTVNAYRGGTPITDEIELKAYLASILRLENIGLLLGAGASCSAGGRTIRQLWDEFLLTASADADWLRTNNFISEDERRPPAPPPLPPVVVTVPGAPSAAAVAGAAAPRVVAPAPVRMTPNVEVLVDKLEVAIIEWTRQGPNPQLAVALRARASLFRVVVGAAKLNADWWTSPKGAELADELAPHRAVLQKLTSARQPGQMPPWIFTTNYDLAIEWAAESADMQVINGFLGVHSRRFSPQSFDLGFRNIQARGEARFGVYNIYLAKLHGSLTWKEIDQNLYEVPAMQAWEELKSFLDGGSQELKYLVLPRAAKYLQTVGYVLGELLRRFAEFLARPQTALIVCGYGFGDEHINRLIRSALLNPTLQIVIYLPEFDGDLGNVNLPPTVKRLIQLQNPRVTIVGGGASAYLTALASQLPDPTIYDDSFADLERKLRPRESDSDEGGGEE